MSGKSAPDVVAYLQEIHAAAGCHLEGHSLTQARKIVSMSGLDWNDLPEGHELDPVRAKLVPKEYIAKMMGRRLAEALLRKWERA